MYIWFIYIYFLQRQINCVKFSFFSDRNTRFKCIYVHVWICSKFVCAYTNILLMYSWKASVAISCRQKLKLNGRYVCFFYILHITKLTYLVGINIFLYGLYPNIDRGLFVYGVDGLISSSNHFVSLLHHEILVIYCKIKIYLKQYPIHIHKTGVRVFTNKKYDSYQCWTCGELC